MSAADSEKGDILTHVALTSSAFFDLFRTAFLSGTSDLTMADNLLIGDMGPKRL